MAGRRSHDALIGVGPALRKAREHRGLTLEEAARDTRLRLDQLQALESEDFDAMSGEVYVRASLRTYAAYLGLKPEKVMSAYARYAEDPEPPPPPGKLGRIERAIAATRVRDSQMFLLIAAATLVGVLIVFGLLSNDHAAPEQAVIPPGPGSVIPSDRTMEATLVAQRPAQVTVTVDGVVNTYRMAKGEQRAFSATGELVLLVQSGGTVEVTVAGRDLGAPGEPGQPWQRTFTYAEVAAWPSPSPSPSQSGLASGSPSGSASGSASASATGSP
jgi:Helix-turn-helix domain